MRIGIIGAGNIGGTLARKFVTVGHEVRIANSRGPETLADVAAVTGAMPATVADAIADADVVVIAVPYKAVEQMPRDLFDGWGGGATIDTGNYFPMRDGTIEALDGSLTDTQWVARHFGRPIIKAFNSISVRSLIAKGVSPGAVALPVAGDDERAKDIAFELVAHAGFVPLDAGSLAESWRQQPGTPATLPISTKTVSVALSTVSRRMTGPSLPSGAKPISRWSSLSTRDRVRMPRSALFAGDGTFPSTSDSHGPP